MSGIRRRLLYAKPKEVPNYLCFTALESGTFTLTIDANLSTSALQYIEYSIDGNTWVKTDNVNSQSVTITTPTIANGGKVYWRGIGNQMANNFSNNPSIFSSTCRFDASGEVMSLLKGENFTKTRNVGNSAFARLFKDCSTIVNAKDLIIEIGSIGSYGLQEMFINCTSLVTTPYINDVNAAYTFNGMFKGCSSLVEVTYDLPVPQTISNRRYNSMFEGCTALVKTPNLPLTEFGSAAYSNMFKGCTSLTTISTLPATSLTDNCYDNMFNGCTSLVDAPLLPATNIPGGAYSGMFQGCINLKNVPDINVTSFTGTSNMNVMFYNCSSLVHCPIKSVPDLAPTHCFNTLFRGCTNLVDAFELPALVLNTYSYINMFRDTKVSYIKMLATDISANGCLGYWVSGVPSSGIFVKNIDATWTDVGASGVPSGWTVIYYDPALDKYYLDQQKEIECDKYGNPIYQSIYVNNGLVFFLDAIKQNERGFSSWVDLSGNYQLSTKVESMSGTHSTFIDFYRYSMGFKNQQGVKFIGEISSGFSIEAIYQPRYTNYNSAIQDTSRSGAQSMLVGFSSSEYFLQANGQLKLPGGSNIGTDVFDNSKIMHITWTYDGSSFKRYVDGVNDVDTSGDFNTSSLTNAFVLGYSDWGWYTRLCMNNIRIYSRALTQAEVTSNYNIDITRFGTENVL